MDSTTPDADPAGAGARNESSASPLPEPASARSRRWAQNYPPLLTLIVAGLIALLVLPSSLNLPNTNPSQTLEYAPVPPDSKTPPPPNANLSQLGLATSGALGAGDADGTGQGKTPLKVSQGEGANPSTKRCVGDPPRQTEDPLSPPCVAFFEGDNFGNTYQGVTAEEIRIVLYYDGNVTDQPTSRGSETRPTSTLVDLFGEPKSDDNLYVRQARLWQRYFNDRFQLYGRIAHFYVYFGSSSTAVTPETRRADAADIYDKVHPFATINLASFSGGGSDFLDAMSKRGVLNFGSFLGQDASFFQTYPKLIWGFLPSLEYQADQFAGIVCDQVVGKSAEVGDGAGGPRKYGLVYTSDPNYASLRSLKDRVVSKFQSCGGSFATDPGVFPTAGYTVDSGTSPRYATDTMVRFRAAGVTTIIWPAGLETNFSKAAAAIGYHPEWILLGDGFTDSDFANQAYGGQEGQNQDVWSNAFVVSPQPQVPVPETGRICFQALRSVDPNTPQQDSLRAGCDMYNDLRQLFIGIQSAGPRLGPTSIDTGFHALPAIPSQNVQVPECYYEPGDYTCIKDYVLAKYDPTGYADSGESTTSSDPGCYQIIGSRRRPAGPASGGLMDEYHTNDLCLGFGGSFQLNAGVPDPTQI